MSILELESVIELQNNMMQKLNACLKTSTLKSSQHTLLETTRQSYWWSYWSIFVRDETRAEAKRNYITACKAMMQEVARYHQSQWNQVTQQFLAIKTNENQITITSKINQRITHLHALTETLRHARMQLEMANQTNIKGVSVRGGDSLEAIEACEYMLNSHITQFIGMLEANCFHQGYGSAKVFEDSNALSASDAFKKWMRELIRTNGEIKTFSEIDLTLLDKQPYNYTQKNPYPTLKITSRQLPPPPYTAENNDESHHESRRSSTSMKLEMSTLKPEAMRQVQSILVQTLKTGIDTSKQKTQNHSALEYKSFQGWWRSEDLARAKRDAVEKCQRRIERISNWYEGLWKELGAQCVVLQENGKEGEHQITLITKINQRISHFHALTETLKQARTDIKAAGGITGGRSDSLTAITNCETTLRGHIGEFITELQRLEFHKNGSCSKVFEDTAMLGADDAFEHWIKELIGKNGEIETFLKMDLETAKLGAVGYSKPVPPDASSVACAPPPSPSSTYPTDAAMVPGVKATSSGSFR